MMKNILIPLTSGIIFGIGLVIAGMTNPAKVMGFLNVFGNWDPSLMFVMGGAIIVSMPAFLFIGKKMSAPLFNKEEGFSQQLKKNISFLSSGASAPPLSEIHLPYVKAFVQYFINNCELLIKCMVTDYQELNG